MPYLGKQPSEVSSVAVDTTTGTFSGEVAAASLDISGNVDVDGVLETDALSIASTTITSTAAELNIMDGVTATAAELNIMDGVTSTTAELNILDGVTSTAAELNLLDGVSGLVQADLTKLAAVDSTAAELNILDGVTSTTAELNILDGVTSTAAELNALDGITAVVGELNALDIGSTAVGTAVASKAVILDSSKDYTGIRNLTITGELDAATLDISGAIDVEGTANLDVVDIDGAVDMATTLQVDGVATFTGRDIHNGGITIANAGQIGSVGDADAIAIASDGVVTMTQIPVLSAGLNVSGGTIAGTLATAAQGNITSLGNLSALTVDDITIDGSTITDAGSFNIACGALTVDATNDIILDAGGQNIIFKDDGTEFGQIYQSSNHLHLYSAINNADIKIQGNDGGATVTAIELDMSDAGSAYFNNTVYIPQLLTHTGDTDTNLEFGTNTIALRAGNVKGISVKADEIVINDGSADVDFRVESNNHANALFVDGADGTFSINGTTTGGDMAKINNSTSAWLLNLNNASASDQIIISSQSGTGTVIHHQLNNSNGLVGKITTNGSTTTYATSSDYRIKENVSYEFDATTRLKQLKPARFNFIPDETNTLVDGFIAHEVSSIVPEAVIGEKDATETYTDDDGNEQTRISPQSIDQSKLVPLLVKTIQELEARITALEGA